MPWGQFQGPTFKTTVPEEGDFAHVLEQIQKKRGDNYFTYLHFYLPDHVTELLYGRCEEKVHDRAYRDRMKKANQLTLEVVDTITKIDPKGMIVIASDHGPTLFNKCSMDNELKTREEVIERQGVFLAIKWGEDYDGRFDLEFKTSANLFRYIFSYLSESDFPLMSKVPDDAFYKFGEKEEVRRSLADGQILLGDEQIP